MLFRLLVVVHSYIVCTCCLYAAPSEKRSARLSLGEVREVLHNYRSRLTSLKADVTSWHRENLGTTRCGRCTVACKGEKRYALVWHGEEQSPDEDPRAYIQLYDGEQWNVFNPYFRRYDVSRKFAAPPYTDKIRANPFFESLGWWPVEDRSTPIRPAGRKYFVHEIIDDERCQLLRDQALIDGVWCHVVEIPALDRLWVDCTRGVVLRRELFPAKEVKGPLASFELSDFRLVDGVVWLPYRIRRVVYPSKVDVITVVDRYEVNMVSDDQFTFTPPPGTLVRDRDTDQFHQVPGGFEVMDRVSRWVRDAARDVTPPLQASVWETAALNLGHVTLGVCIYLAGMTAIRRIKRARNASAEIPRVKPVSESIVDSSSPRNVQ